MICSLYLVFPNKYFNAEIEIFKPLGHGSDLPLHPIPGNVLVLQVSLDFDNKQVIFLIIFFLLYEKHD